MGRTVVQILGFIIPVVFCLIKHAWIVSVLATPTHFLLFFIAWGILILVAQKVFEFAYLDWIVPTAILIGRILVAIIY